jgi:hypothetical protein
MRLLLCCFQSGDELLEYLQEHLSMATRGAKQVATRLCSLRFFQPVQAQLPLPENFDATRVYRFYVTNYEIAE